MQPSPPAAALGALADVRALSIVGASMQAALALVLAGVLVFARRHQQLRAGRDFVVAQLGLAAATTAVVLRNVVGPIPVPEHAGLLLHALAGVYLAGKLTFFLGLGLGAAEMLGRITPPRARRWLWSGTAAVAFAYALAHAGLGVALRIQGIVGLGVMTWSAWTLGTADRRVRTTGMALLSAALALYALLSLAYLSGVRYAEGDGLGSLWHASLFVLDRSSVVDLLGQFLLGIATVVLLLEQQREVAVRDRSQRDALHREAANVARLETLGRVAATVAHELNNPLSVVLGTAEHMLQAASDPAMRDDLHLMLREATRCRHVARDLLLYAREQAPTLAPVDAVEVLREAVDAVRLQAAAAGVALDVQATGRVTLHGDAPALAQVLINLLRNAIEVAPPGTAVRTSVASEGGDVTFAVEDAGPGITPEVRAHLFEPFFTTKPAGKGTGLGLPIVRGIVARHGGSLEVESVPERAIGTRFVVRLPATTVTTGEFAAAREAPSPVVPSVAATPVVGDRWVLVIDDEVGVRRVLGRMVERAGLRAELCADGAAGQAALRHAPLDALEAIFCDVRMPGLDGIGFTAWLAAAHPDVLPRLVLLTGDTVSEEVSAVARQHAVRLMAKPFRREEIGAALGAVTR